MQTTIVAIPISRGESLGQRRHGTRRDERYASTNRLAGFRSSNLQRVLPGRFILHLHGRRPPIGVSLAC